MDIDRLLRVFIFCDFVFVISFCVSGLHEYADNFVVVGLIIIALITYYPLYIYVKEYESPVMVIKDRLWHHSNQHICLGYVFCRLVMLFGFLSIAVIHVSEIDVLRVIKSFSFLTHCALLIMTVVVIVLLWIALTVTPHHRSIIVDNLNVTNINATIIYTNDDGTEYRSSDQYKNLSELEFNTTQKILLIPNASQQNHTFLVTKSAQTDIQCTNR